MEEQAKKVAELLKMLANENRLLALCALISSPKTVSEIAKRVPNISSPALSQHLALLKACGILDSQKSGQNITYEIVDERVIELMDVLKTRFCEPDTNE